MQVYREAIAVSAPPYAHLGYIEALVFRPNATLVHSVAVSLVLAVVLLGHAGIAHRRGLRARHLMPAVLCALLGIALGIASNRIGTHEYEHPVQATRDHGMLLLDREAADPSSPLDPAHALDAWGRSIELRDGEHEGKRVRAAVSAGPDGAFDTADDIVVLPDSEATDGWTSEP